jgi:hypothetical protein
MRRSPADGIIHGVDPPEKTRDGIPVSTEESNIALVHEFLEALV